MHPILLVGAALVGLPILLHLIMKQEPKRLPFPAFRFLKLKLKTNQRKLRLRHFLLLALRMLLIALFALALYQPTVLSEGLNIAGDQPLAVVLVVDTSPSMGYADGKESRLEEAARRALELVNELPDGSRVAVVETGDPSGDWLPSVGDARSRLDDLIKRARAADRPGAVTGGPQPVTSAVAAAYQLLKTADADADGGDPLPRLVAVFTDRAAASWDPARVDDLKKLRDTLPDPKPAHAVVDVGADKPVNVALLSAEVTGSTGQVVPANQPVTLSVGVAATGVDARAGVRAILDDGPPVSKEVEVPAGQTRAVGFEFRDLKPGLHQLRFELETADALMADNARFVTFRVAEPRKVLTIADDPDEAGFWKLALDSRGEFAVTVVRPAAVRTDGGRTLVSVPDPADPTKAKADDLQSFEAVVLFAVGSPAQPAGDPLWAKLKRYVEAGGKLVIIPGPKERMVLDEYNGADGVALMPADLVREVDTRTFPQPKDAKEKDRRNGVEWTVFRDTDDRAFGHPFLAPMAEWRKRGNVDVFRLPRRAVKFWQADKRADGGVIVAYDDADDPAARRPAVLERGVGDKGRVVLLTTRLHVPSDADPAWNDYWESDTTWPVVFPELLLRYAAGSTAEANFNHPVGSTVTVPLVRLLAGGRGNLALDGPGVPLADAVIRPAERQTEVRIGPPRTDAPGNYTLTGPNPDAREGFGLNLPADELTLSKVPAEGVEELTGPGTVFGVSRDVKLQDLLTGSDRFKTPVDLFPWLLIAVLLLLAAEGLLANRFYRRPG